MILPTKHITVENSLLGVGALLLEKLSRPLSISTLWKRVREFSEIATFERFTLALDLLCMIGAIEFDKNKLRRVH